MQRKPNQAEARYPVKGKEQSAYAKAMARQRDWLFNAVPTGELAIS